MMMVNDLWKKAAKSPISLIDWAVKVGVAAAIGLYLVVKMAGILTIMVESNIDTNATNSATIKDIATFTKVLDGTNRKIDATVAALKESQDQACQAAKKASVEAALVLDEMKKQSPIMVDMASSGRERTRLQAEMLAEHKLLKPAIEKMSKEASEERKEFWGRSEKHEAEVLENQKKILDRLPPKPASPAIGVVPK